MTNNSPNRTFLLPATLLLVVWGLLCVFAPWRQVHPWDASLGQALSRAPIWSHTYDGVPGARIDGSEFVLEAGVILLVGLLLLGFYRTLRSISLP